MYSDMIGDFGSKAALSFSFAFSAPFGAFLRCGNGIEFAGCSGTCKSSDAGMGKVPDVFNRRALEEKPCCKRKTGSGLGLGQFLWVWIWF
jgi:hypothetical protein